MKIIRNKEELNELNNKKVVAIIKNRAMELILKCVDDQVVLFNSLNEHIVTQYHYKWYIKRETPLFDTIKECSEFLKLEKLCEQIAESLFEYRKQNGRTWKRKLINEFSNGTNTEPNLQRFRNRFDFHKVLRKIKIDFTVRDIIMLLSKSTKL